LVYDGSLISSVTEKTITSPYIEESKEYVFTIQSKNCGYYSDGSSLNIYSASVPSAFASAAEVSSFDSTTAMTVSWEDPPSNGGFSVESYSVYVDNTLDSTVDASLNQL
jgi:hypothetical protein